MLSDLSVMFVCAVIAIVCAATCEYANERHDAADEIFNGAVEAD